MAFPFFLLRPAVTVFRGTRRRRTPVRTPPPVVRGGRDDRRRRSARVGSAGAAASRQRAGSLGRTTSFDADELERNTRIKRRARAPKALRRTIVQIEQDNVPVPGGKASGITEDLRTDYEKYFPVELRHVPHEELIAPVQAYYQKTAGDAILAGIKILEKTIEIAALVQVLSTLAATSSPFSSSVHAFGLIGRIFGSKRRAAISSNAKKRKEIRDVLAHPTFLYNTELVEENPLIFGNLPYGATFHHLRRDITTISYEYRRAVRRWVTLTTKRRSGNLQRFSIVRSGRLSSKLLKYRLSFPRCRKNGINYAFIVNHDRQFIENAMAEANAKIRAKLPRAVYAVLTVR